MGLNLSCPEVSYLSFTPPPPTFKGAAADVCPLW